jgi:hypothetical protein
MFYFPDMLINKIYTCIHTINIGELLHLFSKNAGEILSDVNGTIKRYIIMLIFADFVLRIRKSF